MTRWPRAHVAAALAIALLLVALATSARPKARPLLRAQYVTAGGLRIRYVRAGRGPTVVLLHGYGESLVAWRGVFDVLAARADVIALDLPGFGLSSKPATGYATDSLAASVERTLAALGVRQAAIVGHSMGGAVAVATALRDSAVITRLVLLDAAVVGQPLGVPDAGRGDRAGETARSAVVEYERLRAVLMATHDAAWLSETDDAAAYSPANDPGYREALAALLREFDFHWLTAERAARIRVPTLVLWGEYDPLFPLSEGRALATAIPGARLEVVPRTWHRPHEERPEAVAASLARFLDIRGDQTPPNP